LLRRLRELVSRCILIVAAVADQAQSGSARLKRRHTIVNTPWIETCSAIINHVQRVHILSCPSPSTPHGLSLLPLLPVLHVWPPLGPLVPTPPTAQSRSKEHLLHSFFQQAPVPSRRILRVLHDPSAKARSNRIQIFPIPRPRRISVLAIRQHSSQGLLHVHNTLRQIRPISLAITSVSFPSSSFLQPLLISSTGYWRDNPYPSPLDGRNGLHAVPFARERVHALYPHPSLLPPLLSQSCPQLSPEPPSPSHDVNYDLHEHHGFLPFVHLLSLHWRAMQ
jgi:hypothetical protein